MPGIFSSSTKDVELPPVGAIDEALPRVREPADAVEGGVTLVVHDFDVPQKVEVSRPPSPAMERGVVVQLVYLSHNLVMTQVLLETVGSYYVHLTQTNLSL